MWHIYLSMMMSNCTGERTFSKMGINIKGVLRSTMRQARLNMLSLMSTEREILRAIYFDDIIDDICSREGSKGFAVGVAALHPITRDCECIHRPP